MSAHQYLEKICKRHSRESKLAASLIWFLSDGNPSNPIHIDDVIDIFISSGLKGKVNKSRLITNLVKERGINKFGKDKFRCRLADKVYLETAFSVDTEHRIPEISFKFMDQQMFPNNHPFLQKICLQINGTYEYRFFDGCAVLLRRLMESMLIEVFETQLSGHLIRNQNGDYKMLNGIISSLGPAPFRLARGSDKIIARVKKVGDNAAHGRAHITRKNDIDDLKIDFRKLMSELKQKSNIA